jgi:hypothetical protein
VDESPEPDAESKELLSELLAAREALRAQIAEVGPMPIGRGPSGLRMRDIQVGTQLRDLNATLAEIEDCIKGLGGDDA